ncbi:MAG: ATP-binding protein [Beduini sp.]
MFLNPVRVNAILDRILHHSHVINIIDKSYKIKDSSFLKKYDIIILPTSKNNLLLLSNGFFTKIHQINSTEYFYSFPQIDLNIQR